MRLLLDENMPKPLVRVLAGHEVKRVQDLGWAGVLNGALVARAEGTFEALLTADKNLRYQQDLTGRSLAIVELPTNRWPLLRDRIELILKALNAVASGTRYVVVDFG
jgi:Domain of unknown function (DUF5615)